jgi:hypothetical protein
MIKKHLAKVNLQWNNMFFNLKKNKSSTLSYHNVLMNILKSYDLNSMTLKKIENFDGEDYSLWFFFYMCKISWTSYY